MISRTFEKKKVSQLNNIIDNNIKVIAVIAS